MAINWAKKLQEIERVNENTPVGDDWFTRLFLGCSNDDARVRRHH